MKDQFETVELLIKHGANVTSRDKYGLTPLHYVVRNLNIAKILIFHGADVKCRDKVGRIPLDLAVDESIQRFLKTYGLKLLLLSVSSIARVATNSKFIMLPNELVRLVIYKLFGK